MTVSATRMNLMNSRGRLALALEGVELLKSKREALIRDFFRVIDTLIPGREEISEDVQRSMVLAALAKSFEGRHSLQAASLSARRERPLETREINIWGIRVPEIQIRSVRRTSEARGILPVDTSPHVMEASESYEALLEKVLNNASHEIRLKRLGEEIRKVNRRINALEQSLIPNLKNQIRGIRDTLQEREREEIFRLKHIKNRRTRGLGR